MRICFATNDERTAKRVSDAALCRGMAAAGKTAEWLVHAEDRERTGVELANLVAGHKIHRFENRLQCKDGSYCWLSWWAVRDQGAIYAVGRDITDIKQAEEQLRASRRELALVSRQTALSTMTASIAHEVGQPLSAIVMNANAALRWLAREEPDLAEARAALQKIVNEGHRTMDMIAGIRATFGKGTREASVVSVNSLIGEVLNLAHTELEGHFVSVHNDTCDRLPQVMVERVQLQQVLFNLVMNAVEAMSSVTDRARLLDIRSECRDGSGVRISIGDSGCGIEPEHMKHVFDAFFTTKLHGMGIGLAICRSIVEAHNGLLWAERRSPHGTTFYLQLPAAEGQ